MKVSFQALFMYISNHWLIISRIISGREAKKNAERSRTAKNTQFPKFDDHEAVQTFFLKEVKDPIITCTLHAVVIVLSMMPFLLHFYYLPDQIQLGEELLGQGKINECVDHIANAVSVCGQPQQLLQVLGQTLPPQVFNLLIERLPVVGQVSITSIG